MPFYRSVGDIPAKRHIQFRKPDGGLYYEELIGEEGFSSNSALVYHENIPAAIVSASEWDLGDMSLRPNNPLLPRHYKLHELDAAEPQDIVTGRRLLLGNGDVRISYVMSTATSPLYRNAIGDELVYIEDGSGTVETMLGVLPYRQGDYVILPRNIIHRWVPKTATRAYIVEANSHIAPPRRYLSKYGQFLEHSPYFERDLHSPNEPLIVEGENVEVFVKSRSLDGIQGTRWVLPTHPFDVVGWDGCLYPYTFNITDFEPITGRVHQPPPAHQVFEANNFVICNFVPRKVDYHPLAIPVPYYHANVDSDEVMFYCGGNYEARRGSGIGQGSVSLHPMGHSHGPQPGAYERSIGIDFFDELAVMVDTFAPLGLGEAAFVTEDPQYPHSWDRNRGS